jgi:F-type H+-transporting ATPase subunit delta
MNAAIARRCARIVLAASAGRGAVEATVEALARAADLFDTEDGRLAADVLQSTRVPAAERGARLEEITRLLEPPREVAALLEALASRRALRVLRAVAARASSLAETFAEVARVEVRTAGSLPEGVPARIASAMERMLGKPTRLEIVEDEGVLAGVVVKAGDRIWDGSLRGRMARVRARSCAP